MRRPTIARGLSIAVASLALASMTACDAPDPPGPHPRGSTDVHITVGQAESFLEFADPWIEVELLVENGTGGPLWLPAADVVVVGQQGGTVLLANRVPDAETLSRINFAQDPGPASASRIETGSTRLTMTYRVPLIQNVRWDEGEEWLGGVPPQVSRVRFCLAVVDSDAVEAAGFDPDGNAISYPWDSGTFAETATLACSDPVDLGQAVPLNWDN